MDEAPWRAAWDLKVFGYINMTRAMMAGMVARGEGVIVNVVGLAGLRMDAGYVCGSVGNAALDAFTRAVGGSPSTVACGFWGCIRARCRPIASSP